MKLDLHVCRRTVARLYRERDEYILSYLSDTDTDTANFVSPTLPVREALTGPYPDDSTLLSSIRTSVQ